MTTIVEKLLGCQEPSIRYKIRTKLQDEDPHSPGIIALREEIRHSPRVDALLHPPERMSGIAQHVYRKFAGAHWVLASLADIGTPPGDPRIAPLAELVYACWLHPRHVQCLLVLDGRVRKCASQEGNAIYSLITLGFSDQRIEQLADILMKTQWPDGGWNCDRRPQACHSSFWESLLPLRGLSLYARISGNPKAREASERTAELFLKRHLFRRLRDGAVMNNEFTSLHYPCYWHYDILAGLKVMSEAGFLSDPRCNDALDLLESKRLPEDGWAAEGKYYRMSKTPTGSGGCELVSWGVSGKTRMNEWVTADALAVLHAAGRV